MGIEKTSDMRDMSKENREMTARVEGIERKRRVLLIYRVLIPSVRLCGHCQMEYLAEQGRLEYRAVQEMKLVAEDIDWADILLLGRLDSWYEHRLSRMAHEAGKYLAYILDDDLLNIPPEISSGYYYGQREIQEYIRDMIELSDAIVSPSPLLLEKYASGKRAIQIEEPAIDPVEYRPRASGEPVKIGFAGSIDRIEDIEDVLRDALIQIGDAYGDRVRFEFLGAEPDFAKRLGARCVPYCDAYEEYRRALNALQWDIGLAPMPDTPFHACKHYNKFSEYAAAGIVGVFSDVYPYTRIKTVFPGCGVFCENTPESWVQALRGLIEDFDGREDVRRRATQCAWSSLNISRCAEGLWAALPSLSTLETPGKKIIGLGFLKVRNLWERLKTKYRGYGVRGLLSAAGQRARGIAERFGQDDRQESQS